MAKIGIIKKKIVGTVSEKMAKKCLAKWQLFGFLAKKPSQLEYMQF